MKRPTIKDVAAAAGVSTSSVSHVLNGTKTVSADISKRVRQAVRELEYRPSAIATSLRRRSSGVIGLVLPMRGNDTSSVFFTQLADGVEAAVSKHGYRTMISNTDEDTERERAHLQVLRGHFVDFIDALVIAPTVASGDNGLAVPISDGIPLVFVDRMPGNAPTDIDYVGTDNYEVSSQGISAMLAKGARDVVCLSSPIDVSSMLARKDAFVDAVGGKMTHVHERIFVGESSYESGIEVARRAFERFPDLDGLFITNSSVAMGAANVILERQIAGKRTPQLLIYDHYDWMNLLPFPYTAIHQPAFDMGYKTGELLIRRLAQPSDHRSSTIVRSALVEHTSIEQRSER